MDIDWGGDTNYNVAEFISAFPTEAAGCIEADPLFVDASNNNFNLLSGSPAIDNGTLSDVYQTFFDLYGIDIRKDFEGNSRPFGSGWDIGAYEWGSTPPDPEPEPEPEPQPEPEPLADIPDVTSLQVSNNIIKKSGNTSATIQCNLKEAGNLSVTIYDAKGREIITLCNEHKDAGVHSFPWTGVDSGRSTVGSGIYMVQMKAGGYTETKKIAVIK